LNHFFAIEREYNAYLSLCRNCNNCAYLNDILCHKDYHRYVLKAYNFYLRDKSINVHKETLLKLKFASVYPAQID